MTLSPAQATMLRHLHEDGEPTDYAEFADRGGSALGWRNRERVLSALMRKGLVDDDLKLTDTGRESL